MPEPDDRVITTVRRASQHGWVRRSDLGLHVWELPDGSFHTHYDDTEPMVVTLPPLRLDEPNDPSDRA